MNKSQLSKQQIREIISSPNSVEIIYELVQKNQISLNDFQTLIAEIPKERQRQIDLDTFN